MPHRHSDHIPRCCLPAAYQQIIYPSKNMTLGHELPFSLPNHPTECRVQDLQSGNQTPSAFSVYCPHGEIIHWVSSSPSRPSPTLQEKTTLAPGDRNMMDPLTLKFLCLYILCFSIQSSRDLEWRSCLTLALWVVFCRILKIADTKWKSWMGSIQEPGGQGKVLLPVRKKYWEKSMTNMSHTIFIMALFT